MYGRIFALTFDSILVTVGVTIQLTIRFDDLDSTSDDLDQVFDDLHQNFDHLD